MEELAPCPICKSPAKILNWQNSSFVIECSQNNNSHCVYIKAKTREEAIKLWNNRQENTCKSICYTPYFKLCSVCRHSTAVEHKYCPNCGRKFVCNDKSSKVGTNENM